MKRIKAGVVGCGNISGAYLRNLADSPFVQVAAVADLDPERAKSKAEEFGIENVYTLPELLAQEDIELVINLTVPSSHAAVHLAALEAGKHVYGEKPLAVTLEEARRVMELAAVRGLRVGCAPDTFLGSGIQTARKAIEDGLIGRPLAASGFMMGGGPESWHPDPEFFYAPGGGPLFDMGPYYITALVELLGPVGRVSSLAAMPVPERRIGSGPKAGQLFPVRTATHLSGVLEMRSGVLSTVTFSFDIAGGSELPLLEIHGTEGSLSLPDPNRFDGNVRLRRRGEEWTELEPVFGSRPDERGIGVNDMVEAIREGRPHRASGERGFHVLETMHAFIRSASEGKHIPIASGEALTSVLYRTETSLDNDND